MKKKPLYTVTPFVAVLYAVILGISSVQAAPQVLIGFVLPQTNSSANTGKQIKLGATIAAEEINNNGGVASLGGAKLKLIFTLTYKVSNRPPRDKDLRDIAELRARAKIKRIKESQ